MASFADSNHVVPRIELHVGLEVAIFHHSVLGLEVVGEPSLVGLRHDAVVGWPFSDLYYVLSGVQWAIEDCDHSPLNRGKWTPGPVGFVRVVLLAVRLSIGYPARFRAELLFLSTDDARGENGTALWTRFSLYRSAMTSMALEADGDGLHGLNELFVGNPTTKSSLNSEPANVDSWVVHERLLLPSYHSVEWIVEND